jgi:hypothetical protein
MASFRSLAFAIAGLLFAADGAAAADRVISLKIPSPLRPGIAAMPTIAAAKDEAERRINTALRRLDATMRKTTAGCTGPDGRRGEWERSVEAPMRGPGYLSLVVTDVITCAGRGPGIGVMSIVYDLTTGTPVDWTRLLPPDLTGKVALETGADGTRMVTLASTTLHALYLAGYRPGDVEPSCREAVSEPGAGAPPAMMVWPDAKAGGLVLQFNLPRAAQACSDPVVISSVTLRRHGADARLLAAIDAAHRAGAY